MTTPSRERQRHTEAARAERAARAQPKPLRRTPELVARVEAELREEGRSEIRMTPGLSRYDYAAERAMISGVAKAAAKRIGFGDAWLTQKEDDGVIGIYIG